MVGASAGKTSYLAPELLKPRDDLRDVPVLLRRLIMEMTTNDPAERPSVAEVYTRLHEMYMASTNEGDPGRQSIHSPGIAAEDPRLLSAYCAAALRELPTEMDRIQRGNGSLITHIVEISSMRCAAASSTSVFSRGRHVLSKHRYVCCS